MVHVENLADVEWSDQAFENLILPQKEKALALSFVEQKLDVKTSFDDFIANKSESGPPQPSNGSVSSCTARSDKHTKLFQVAALSSS